MNSAMQKLKASLINYINQHRFIVELKEKGWLTDEQYDTFTKELDLKIKMFKKIKSGAINIMTF